LAHFNKKHAKLEGTKTKEPKEPQKKETQKPGQKMYKN